MEVALPESYSALKRQVRLPVRWYYTVKLCATVIGCNHCLLWLSQLILPGIEVILGRDMFFLRKSLNSRIDFIYSAIEMKRPWKVQRWVVDMMNSSVKDVS